MTRTLLRGAHVITMAAHRPDAERLDILITNDIAAVGVDFPTTGVTEVVDLAGRIVIPGLVNAHLQIAGAWRKRDHRLIDVDLDTI